MPENFQIAGHYHMVMTKKVLNELRDCIAKTAGSFNALGSILKEPEKMFGVHILTNNTAPDNSIICISDTHFGSLVSSPFSIIEQLEKEKFYEWRQDDQKIENSWLIVSMIERIKDVLQYADKSVVDLNLNKELNEMYNFIKKYNFYTNKLEKRIEELEKFVEKNRIKLLNEFKMEYDPAVQNALNLL